MLRNHVVAQLIWVIFTPHMFPSDPPAPLIPFRCTLAHHPSLHISAIRAVVEEAPGVGRSAFAAPGSVLVSPQLFDKDRVLRIEGGVFGETENALQAFLGGHVAQPGVCSFQDLQTELQGQVGVLGEGGGLTHGEMRREETKDDGHRLRSRAATRVLDFELSAA
jgi:hypothetical protein